MEKFVSNLDILTSEILLSKPGLIPVSLFNVVTFPNDPCDAGTRNGTCYTK